MDLRRMSKSNYKTPSYFTGFHHLAYIECIKGNTGKSKTAKQQSLPKISYLVRKIKSKNSRYLVENGKVNLIKYYVKSCKSDYSNLGESFRNLLNDLEMTQIKIENDINKLYENNVPPKSETLPKDDRESAKVNDVTATQVENMKTLIVRKTTNYSEENSTTRDDKEPEKTDNEKSISKFQRETKIAFTILTNRSQSETKISNTIYNKSNAMQERPETSLKLHLPCVKNLLCKKGFHSGRCECDY
ncbi:hypothetical protein FQA39_LY18080 [Lamprigera yunnana]|nr:hypothetical protein FQA39_LY18080 [Lamprigera yunnana]